MHYLFLEAKKKGHHVDAQHSIREQGMKRLKMRRLAIGGLNVPLTKLAILTEFSIMIDRYRVIFYFYFLK